MALTQVPLPIDVCGNTTETATASLNASGSGSANYTSVTISPAGGASRTISGSIAGAALVELNGADNVTIDGLNSGGNSLTISNTSTSSTSGTSTIRLLNDATGNTITNCSILGSSTTGLTTNGGTIFISTAASGGNGNDNNTFSNNKIGPAGTNLPTKAVYANGSTSTTASYNNNVTFSNNEIFDYFSASAASVGVYLSGGNDNWTISNNKFYQTAARTQTTGSLHAAINVASSTGNTSHTFSGNIIGFANATGTGTYQITLGSGGRFAGILVSSAGTGGNYNIQNNTITSINIAGAGNGTSTSAGFAAILMGSGSTATISGNTIGSTTTNPAISYSSSSSSASDVYGIYFFPSANVTISNNTIAGITATNSSTGSVVIYGIRAFTASSATNTIQNNIVGSSSAPIQNNASSTSSRVIGIYSQSGASVVTGNTVRNLTMSAGNTGTGTSASVIGILSDNTSATNNNISQNTIHSLSNTNTTAAVGVTGLVYNGNTSAGTYLVARNFIHSLSVSSSGAAVLRGILNAAGGNTTYQNNMIRLGIDAAGNSVTGPYDIAGYAETGGSNNLYHNTIYIGGSSGTSNVFTNALLNSVSSNPRNFINNVLINDRSISGGSGANLAATFTGTLPNPSGLTSNYNFYYSQNANTLIRNGSTNYSLSGWKSASGNQDANSFQASSVAQFNLANPTGDASNVDLHIASTGSTILEQTGTPISSVTDDFDGQLRANFTPVDIGADAGNFTQLDAFPPVITYTPLNNTASTSNRNLSVTITDFTGVASGSLAPRIYYRKGTSGLYVSTQCTGTQPNYTCTIDYSFVGGVVAGDTIQYFVVAQDTLGNLSANPANGFAGTDVNNITSPPTNPNQYNIAQAFSGTLNVGSSEPITSLTNTGGLFELLNNNALVGNLTVIITSDLTNETGTNPLNQLLEEGSGAGTYTITIQPSGARTIEFTATGAGIRLTGADRVTIDGLNTGGNSLTIRNPNDSATATISFSNDSSNNIVRNATIEGAATSTSGGVVFLGSGTTTGNDNNTITQNVIRNLSVGTGTPAYLINSSGSSSTVTNTNNSITNNILKNFTSTGINISSTGNESWTITGNEIFEEAAQTTSLTGISFASLGTNTISQNSIHDLNTSGLVTGIRLGDARNTTVSRNRIFSIPSTNGSTGTLVGILFAGASGTPASVTIVNNMISIIPSFSNNQTIYGIRDFGFSGNTVTIDHNTVLIGGTATGSATWALVRGTVTPTTFTARNNILFNNRTGGSVNHFAIGDQSANSGSWTSNHNIFVGTGTTPANFFDYGTSSSGTAVSFTIWQAGPPSRDANSQASNPTGNYTVGNMFLSPTDLHLNVIGTNPALSSCLPLTAVTTDFDNDPRPAGTNPADIGADEVVQSISGVLAGGTYYNAAIAPGDSLGGNVTVTFNLTLGGVLNTGTNTLTFGCNATVSNVSTSNYVVGNVAKQFCTTGSFTYPIGSSDPNEYSPVTVNVTALGQNPSTLTASVTDATLPGLVPSRSVSRYWTLTEAGDITADLTFQYLDSGGEDVPSTANESDFRVFRKTGTLITNLCPSSPCVNTTANTASVSGVNSFSDWGIGEQVATPGPADASGRVMTSSGRGIPRARVVVTDENGETRVTQTNPFGYYKFRGLTSGQNYIFTVSHKLYRFSQPSIVRFIVQDETDINFIADGFNEGVNTQETYFDRAPFDFDGDGRTDVSVWRSSEGQWYIRRSSDGRWESQNFGVSYDLIAPADYDGDGRTDMAIFRPSEGKWYILLSANSELLIQQFGKNGDQVVPTDYDGDGRADIAVFRPDENRFYILRSSDGQVCSEAFDTKGTLIPMSGDMDGDGKADLGVYNLRTGAWQVIVSHGTERRAGRIEAGGVPVLVDIDGDGRAEIGVYLGKSKLWRFRTSQGISETESRAGNIPVLGDYDGDGKVDVGTYEAGE